jgi:EmrB/QacA subfamily drug resistance transporter
VSVLLGPVVWIAALVLGASTVLGDPVVYEGGSVASLEERADAAAARSRRGQVLAGLMLVIALAAMDNAIVATVVPPIVEDLGGFSLFPWLFSVYLLAQAAAVPIYGKLADLYGRKPVLITGVLIFLAGSVLCGISWNMVALIAFRGVQGLGAGAILPIATTVVGDLYTVVERARIQAWLSSVWGVSAVIGPAIGGLLAEHATWRWIFYVNLPVGAVALFMVVTRLREQVARRSQRIDVAGSVLVFLGVGLLILGLLEGGVHWAWTSAPSITVLSAAALALTGFVWQERRAPEPTVPGWVLTRRAPLGAALANGVIGLLMIGMITYLPTYAQGVLGTTPVVAGFTLALMTVGWSSAAALSGRLYLRIGFRNTALCGVSLMLLAGLLLSLLPGSAPLWAVALASLLMGGGIGLPAVSLLVGVQSVVGWERRGVVTGTALFTRMVGSAVGAAVFGSVANSTLVSWFRRAPASIRGRLPSVNAASDALGGAASPANDAVAAYVRQGLDLAGHRVFHALAAVAVLGVAAVLAAPRRFTTLRFEDDPADLGSGR